jgi:hypothetical protein
VTSTTFRSKQGCSNPPVWISDPYEYMGGHYKRVPNTMKNIRIQMVAHKGGRVLGSVKAGDFQQLARKLPPKRGFVIEISRELADKLVNLGG